MAVSEQTDYIVPFIGSIQHVILDSGESHAVYTVRLFVPMFERLPDNSKLLTDLDQIFRVDNGVSLEKVDK